VGLFLVKGMLKFPGLLVVSFLEELVHLVSELFHLLFAALVETTLDGMSEGSEPCFWCTGFMEGVPTVN